MGKIALQQGLVLGNRIPRTYFCTAGFGQSREGSGLDPFHTESFDAALRTAGIENYNVMTYSSVIPPEAEEIPREVGLATIHHGSVVESIMATASATKGHVVVAAVGRIRVYDDQGVYIGGFAAEFKNSYAAGQVRVAEQEARRSIAQSLGNIFERRYRGLGYRYTVEPLAMASGMIDEQYGTAIAALCWISYIYPVLGESSIQPAPE